MNARDTLIKEVQELVDLLEIRSLEFTIVEGKCFQDDLIVAFEVGYETSSERDAGYIHAVLTEYSSGKIVPKIKHTSSEWRGKAINLDNENKQVLFIDIVTRLLHTMNLFFDNEIITKAKNSYNVNPDMTVHYVKAIMKIRPKSYVSNTVYLDSASFTFVKDYSFSLWNILMSGSGWKDFYHEADDGYEDLIRYDKPKYRQRRLEGLKTYISRVPSSSIVYTERIIDEHIEDLETLHDYLYIFDDIEFF